MKKLLTLPFYLKLACLIIIVIGLVYIGIVGKAIIMPLAMGMLISLLILPFCTLLETKLRFSRTLASLLSITLFFGFIGVFAFFVGAQLTIIKEDWPAFQEQFLSVFDSFQLWVNETIGVNAKRQMEILNDTASKTVNAGTAAVGVVLTSVTAFAITCVFVFLYSFFLLLYRGHIYRFLMLINAEQDQPIVMEILEQVKYVVKKYLVGLLIQMALVSTLVYVTLLVLGVKHSLIFGIITGVLNVLPYVGILIGAAFILLITFATTTLTKVLIVAVAMVVIHAIDSNFIVPKIVGSKVKINSMFAMIAIVFGEMIWGVSGMFLAIPLLAIAKIIFDRVKDLQAWGFLLGEDDHPFENLLHDIEEDKKAEAVMDESQQIE